MHKKEGLHHCITPIKINLRYEIMINFLKKLDSYDQIQRNISDIKKFISDNKEALFLCDEKENNALHRYIQSFIGEYGIIKEDHIKIIKKIFDEINDIITEEESELLHAMVNTEGERIGQYIDIEHQTFCKSLKKQSNQSKNLKNFNIDFSQKTK